MKPLTRTRLHVLLPLVFLVSGVIACTLPVGGPAPTSEPESIPTVVFTQEALTSFEAKVGELLDNTGGPFSITFTESELGAVICQELERAKATGAEIPISDPGVALEDNQIKVYGKLDIPGINATGWVSILPAITPDGLLDLTVVSVEFGFIEFQPQVLQEITDALENSINDYLFTADYRVALTEILVDGEGITLTGTIVP